VYLDFPFREKRAKDEPRCEELRADNSALTTRMFSTKEVQATVVQAVEALKTEKNDLLKRKASLSSDPLVQLPMFEYPAGKSQQ